MEQTKGAEQMCIKQTLCGAVCALLIGFLVLALAVLMPVEVEAAQADEPGLETPTTNVDGELSPTYATYTWTLTDDDLVVEIIEGVATTTIATAEQLCVFSEAVACVYEDFPAGAYTYNVTIGGDINLSSNSYTFTSIGTDDYPFKGTFNGGSKTITLNGTPLFGNVGSSSSSTTTIKNVNTAGSVTDDGSDYDYFAAIACNITNTTVTSCTNNATVSGSGTRVGGIVGYAKSSNLESCTNSATVTCTGDVVDTYYVGGIVGQAETSTALNNCVNSGAVNATVSGNYTAGVVGFISGGGVTSCTNSANVTSNGAYTAGIAGYATSCTITSCATTSGYTITSTTDNTTSYAGGVVGQASSGVTIYECTNSATVVSTAAYTGGVVGYTLSSTITNGTNYGAVTSNSNISNVIYTGGVVGQALSATITSCANHADVAHTSTAGYPSTGGVVGSLNSSSITQSGNLGAVTESLTYESAYAGGIAGNVSSASDYEISQCYNTGEVTAYTAGGFIGRSQSDATLNHCANLGTVIGASCAGGIVGTAGSYTLYGSYVYSAAVVKAGTTYQTWLVGSDGAYENDSYYSVDVLGLGTGDNIATCTDLCTAFTGQSNWTIIDGLYPILANVEMSAVYAIPVVLVNGYIVEGNYGLFPASNSAINDYCTAMGYSYPSATLYLSVESCAMSSGQAYVFPTGMTRIQNNLSGETDDCTYNAGDICYLSADAGPYSFTA